MSRHSPPRSAQIFSSSDPCCTTIPKGQRRGSVQQRCCVGCAPQKLSFVRLSFSKELHMPHSMVLAEPIGLIAGIVAGRVGGRFGRHVAQELGVPTWIGGLVGAAAAHYLSAAVTKAIINATLLDPVGGTANVTVTSPLTSVTHGLFDALTDAIPDLGGWLGELFNDSSLVDTVGEFLSDALPTTPDEVRDALAEAGIDPATYSSEQIDALTTNFSHASASHGEPRFAGFGGVDLINDSQGMSPTCFPESVENIFQLYQGDVSGINNDLV